MPDAARQGQSAGPAFARAQFAGAAFWEPVRVRPTNLLILLTAPAFGPAMAPFLPFRHWLVDLPACFPVQAAMVLLPTCLALAVARRWRFATAYLLGALLALFAIVPGWLAAGRAAGRDGLPMRVLALNLLRGNEAMAPAALAAVRAHAPDLLLCTEVTPAWLAALQTGLVDFPHRFEAADPGYFGIALYSKLPLSQAAAIPLGHTWAPALRAVVATAAGPVALLGVHTPRPGMGSRCAERDAALAAIPAALASLPSRRIVLGDFNATPWNRCFVEMLAATGLVDAGGDWFRPTWTTGWPWLLRVPIDHILTSGGIGVTISTTGPDFGSDHSPLFVELRLAER